MNNVFAVYLNKKYKAFRRDRYTTKHGERSTNPTYLSSVVMFSVVTSKSHNKKLHRNDKLSSFSSAPVAWRLGDISRMGPERTIKQAMFDLFKNPRSRGLMMHPSKSKLNPWRNYDCMHKLIIYIYMHIYIYVCM